MTCRISAAAALRTPVFAGLALLGLALLGCGPADRLSPSPAPPALAPGLRDAMVAELPRHSIPIAVDVTDGFTFSGFTRSTKSGAIDETLQFPFGPFTTSGHQTRHLLSWQAAVVDNFLDCDPTLPVSSRGDSVTNQLVLHYTVDATGTPGDVTAVNVVIPAVTPDPTGSTIGFPITLLGVEVVVTAGGASVNGVLSPVAPPAGAALAYLVTFPAPLVGVAGAIAVDVILTAEVDPPLVPNPNAPTTQTCPGPDGIFGTADDLTAPQTNFQGLSQLLMDNQFVVVFVEPAVQSALSISPSSATLDVSQTQTFSAFDCPTDANGNPDPGPDGVPGTSDDLCTSKANTSWQVQGSIGTVSDASGPTTTLLPFLPAGSVSETGQVVASDGAFSAAANVTVLAASPPQALAISPQSSTLASGSSQAFSAFDCPLDANGNPDPGPDGVPGTSDDICTPKANTSWTTQGGIGTLSSSLGASTTLAAANLAPGETRSGLVVASTPGSGTASASVDVVGPPAGAPTHTIDLEVERMFRQGLPFAEDASAGDDQIVVRPTTAHELNESVDTMVVGGTILPFDAGASLLGELVTCERTILATNPADLPAMVQAILADVAAAGGDPTDPRAIARFLRDHPNRGRIVLTLDAGIDLDLSTSEGAYVGSLDAGFLGFRPDLLLREAQRERVVDLPLGPRTVRIAVNLVEGNDVTNVLPYRERVRWRDARRLARSPAQGGIFQGAGEPGMAQLIAVVGGLGFPGSRGRTNLRSWVQVHSDEVGETSARAAHGLAHLVGHLLFGPFHDRGSTLSILHPFPPTDEDFYEQRFDDFVYSDRTVRRGNRHLDRRWRTQ